MITAHRRFCHLIKGSVVEGALLHTYTSMLSYFSKSESNRNRTKHLVHGFKMHCIPFTYLSISKLCGAD